MGEKAGCVNVEDASTAFVTLVMSVRIMLPFLSVVSSLGGGRSRARIMTGLDGQKGTAFIIVRYVLEPGRRPSERVYDFRRAEIGCSIALVENYGFMKV